MSVSGEEEDESFGFFEEDEIEEGLDSDSDSDSKPRRRSSSSSKFKLPKLKMPKVKLPKMPKIDVSFRVPTGEEVVDVLADFKDVVSDALPTRKDVRTHRRRLGRGYNGLMTSLDELESLDSIEELTMLPRVVLFWLAVTVLAALVAISFFVKSMGLFMTRFVGMGYPAYASLKALITKTKDDDTQWLMYWVVYSFFALFEQLALKQSQALPIYFSFKIIVLSFCMFANGAGFLYTGLIRPLGVAFRTSVLNERDNL